MDSAAIGNDIKRQRAVNESINTLLSVVQYLNQVQDGDAVRIDQTYIKTEMEKRSRILNCHEEDIMNASLITMKRLIETLLPVPSLPSKSPLAYTINEPLGEDGNGQGAVRTPPSIKERD